MKISSLEVSVYRIPTDRPEADGTIYWDSTTLVLVEARADSGETGLGYSYASKAAAVLIADQLASLVTGMEAEDTGACWQKMVRSVRNTGRPGIASTAISAVDIALWDLKARLLSQPLFLLLGPYRRAVPIYGSGGFTTYSDQETSEQLGGWVAEGIPRVKMKIGKDWGSQEENDLHRVQIARQAIGPTAELFVDANGAYTAKQAIRLAEQFREDGVTYFEEPVSSDQLEQLAFIRGQISQDVAAGEYGYDPWYFRDMLKAGAVDILQADATRCLGITGWLQAAALAHSFAVPFSAHTAPTVHAHAGCAAPRLAHVEYFYDHVRIEKMAFDGLPRLADGCLWPDPGRPGLGIELKRADIEQWRIS